MPRRLLQCGCAQCHFRFHDGEGDNGVINLPLQSCTTR
jgi:hypothetical protein